SGGINLYIGNHPGATGAYDEPWADRDAQFAARHTELEEASIRMASTLAGRDLTPEQASGLWAGKALAFVSGHPGEAAKLTLRKALLLLNAQEIPNHLNFSFLRRHAPALWSMPVGLGVGRGGGTRGDRAPAPLAARALARLLDVRGRLPGARGAAGGRGGLRGGGAHRRRRGGAAEQPGAHLSRAGNAREGRGQPAP